MNKVNIPKLRFSGFEGEWEVKKLGNYCSFNQGVQVDLELQLREPKHGYTRFIRIENYTQKSNDFRYIPNKLTNKKAIDENEIAVVRYGATAGFIGKGLKGVLANNLFKVIPNIEFLDSSYLFEFLNSYKAFTFFQNEMSGGAMPALSFGIVNALTISFPSLPEQQKIASFLSSVDEKIQQLSRKKELLEQYKKGVMQQLFSGKLRFKDENGKDYADWEEKKLGEVLKIGSGKDYKHLEQGNIPVFGTGGYMLSVNKFLHKGETVFIGRKGTIDKPFYFNGEFWTVDTLFYTHSFNKTIPKFIYCVFQQINWKLHNEASGVPSLSKSTIEKLKFDLPSLPEQQKIANFLSGIDDKIENTHQEINKMQGFKKGLLQQMFV